MTQNNKEMKELCDGITRNPKCPFHGGKVIIKPQTPKRMTLPEVIKRNEEMFEKEFGEVKCLGHEKDSNFSCLCGDWLDDKNWDRKQFKSFLRFSQESIVEWVREWAKKRSKELGLLVMNGSIRDEDASGYSSAISDLLQELQ